MAPFAQVQLADRGPRKFVMEFTSRRELIAGAALIALAIALVPLLNARLPALAGLTLPAAVILLIGAVIVKRTLFDDHWIVDPPARQILIHRRFLSRVSITPVLSFDEVAALVVTRRPDLHGHSRDEVHLELKGGRREILTQTSFDDVPPLAEDRAHPQHAALAALIGVPLRVVTVES